MIFEIYNSYKVKNPDFQFTNNSTLESLPMKIDEEAMKMVFTNLFENAIKYSLKERAINLKLDISGNNLHIQIADHGIGIPEEEQQKVFEKFYRIVIGTGFRRCAVDHSSTGTTSARYQKCIFDW